MISEGSSLYFTTERCLKCVRNALSTHDVKESEGNLYFTDERAVRALKTDTSLLRKDDIEGELEARFDGLLDLPLKALEASLKASIQHESSLTSELVYTITSELESKISRLTTDDIKKAAMPTFTILTSVWMHGFVSSHHN